jgi:subtilisin-like proprotein convertase family protein
MTDCADPDCANALECASAFTCPATQQKIYVRGNDLPAFIQSLSTTVSNASVTATGQVTKAAVQMSMRHDFIGDLQVFLVPPSGSPLLIANHEGFGADYQHTILLDDGPQSLSEGDPPYAGTFRPDAPFSSLIGANAMGDWALHVVETENDGVVGALVEYGLALCVCDGCELGLACNNGNDDDNDNLTDCADPDCAGTDTCALAALCEPGQVMVQVSPAGLPISIPDSSSVQITIPVTQAGTVKRVGVRFSINHTFDGDLQMDLATPNMTSVTLFDGIGSSGDNFTDTTLVDSGSTLINDGIAPFTGIFRPTNALAGLSEQPALGNWKLTMSDQAGADTGAVVAYDLFICVQP